MLDVAIVDYGMGNLRSVLNAFRHVAPGAAIDITDAAPAVRDARRVVVPGQAAMPDTMAALKAPELNARLTAEGAELQPMTPAQFSEHVRVEIERIAKVVKAGNITAE